MKKVSCVMRHASSYRFQLSCLISFFLLATCNLLLATSIYAVCPVCTVAVGAGLGLARFLGVDDTVSGVWIGGLVLSSSFWFSSWLSKKNFSFLPQLITYHLSLIISFLMYLLTILPLWFAQIIGHPFNTIFGIDKLIFGTITGSLVFLLAFWFDKFIRQRIGHQLFIYQKVVFPVSFLGIISLVFFLTLR
ncbi:MAG: hypothetical protein V1808_04280 [Candidatus Daviesbacteria bacterium]